MIIKLILICLSNSFFNFFMKMKNEKLTVFRFPFFYENKKRMKVFKIQIKNLLNMKMVVNYLNFVFFIEVKSKSKYRILNFVFQFIKSTKWYFGYTDYLSSIWEHNYVKSVWIPWFFAVCIFLFGLNTEIYKINFRVQSVFEKMEIRKTPSLDTFHATCGYHKHTYWLLLIHTPKKIFERK